MVKVLFNSPREFCDELKSHARSGVLRITKIYRRSSTLPFTYLGVVAGYLDRDSLVELEYWIGELSNIRELDHDYEARADKLVNTISEIAQSVGLEVRAGHFVSMDDANS